jgi:acetyl esterase/lipase
MKSPMLAAIFLLLAFTTVHAQDAAKGRGGRAYPPQLKGCRVETYKTIGDTKMNLYIFSPQEPKNAPAIVFFFGGGWTSG